VIKHYPRGDRNYGSSSNSNSDSYGRSNPDEETLTRDASRCGGLCVPPAHCASLKGKARGFCGPSGQGPRVCCACEFQEMTFVFGLIYAIRNIRSRMVFHFSTCILFQLKSHVKHLRVR
jgi:hypothetical protein